MSLPVPRGKGLAHPARINLDLGGRPGIPGRKKVVTDTLRSQTHQESPLRERTPHHCDVDGSLRLYLRQVLGKLLPPLRDQPSHKDLLVGTEEGVCDTRDINTSFRLCMPQIERSVSAPLELSGDHIADIHSVARARPDDSRAREDATVFNPLFSSTPSCATPSPFSFYRQPPERIKELAEPKAKVVRARITSTDVYPPLGLNNMLSMIRENKLLENQLQRHTQATKAQAQLRQRDAALEFERHTNRAENLSPRKIELHKEKGLRHKRSKKQAQLHILKPKEELLGPNDDDELGDTMDFSAVYSSPNFPAGAARRNTVTSPGFDTSLSLTLPPSALRKESVQNIRREKEISGFYSPGTS